MSECPHCGNELKYPEAAYRNADAYGGPVTVATGCCGKGIVLTRAGISIRPRYGPAGKDDWGDHMKASDRQEKSDPLFDQLLKDAKATVDGMTPEERQKMYEAQRQSWARGEMELGKSDKDRGYD